MPKSKKPLVCMLSCRHDLSDDRIYKKEALSLAANGYEVVHIGYGNCESDVYTEDHIHLIQLKRLTKGADFRLKLAVFRQLFLSDLFQAARQVRADVYHLHDVELCRIALKLRRLPQHPKIIYDAHEPFPENLKDYWRRRSLWKVLLNDLPALRAEKKWLKKADYLIATEENVALRFRKENPRTAIVYNYSYFAPFNPLVRTKEPRRFDVIYSGSITESKGIFLMLAGLIEAKKRGHVFRCVMVGAFNDRFLQEKVEAVIHRESLEDQVFFAGMLPLEKVTEYYRQSKIAFCLFPKNRTNQLILPIKLFEYAAFGLPVVGSDFGHIAEIIQTDQIGVCVDPHDAGAVATALIDLLAENRYQTFIPACIKAVETKYLWGTQEKELLRVYEKIMTFRRF